MEWRPQEKLRRHKFEGFLIFITILKEMVFQSFEVQAFDYLVKPIEKEHFEKTMEAAPCNNTGYHKSKPACPKTIREHSHPL